MLGLIGYPLGHSFSEKYFTEKFKDAGIRESYRLFEIEHIEALSSLISVHPDLRGLNVTIPYKKRVIPMLDAISEEASVIGAVNVIKIGKDGDRTFLKGYNTDCIGFRDSLPNAISTIAKNALVLGTGGASMAVEYALRRMGIEVTKVSRHPDKSKRQLGYQELNQEIVAHNLLIVNTTPLGMYPDLGSAPPFPYGLLGPNHFCYDLVYNPEVTEFMKRSASHGARVKNGLEMLYRQADAALDIWDGVND